MATRPKVIVCGPSSWNQIIELDQLPEPMPHQQVARSAWHTVGGTSAGKALHLASLGIDTRLYTPLGDDAQGNHVRIALTRAGIGLCALPSITTEQHVNLMAASERISIYTASASAPTSRDIESTYTAVRNSDLAVIDLSELGLRVIERAGEEHPPIWVDLHDYDGRQQFHQPFLHAASVVFMNNDATLKPWELLNACLREGPQLAICTLGKDGAIAMDATGQRWTVSAHETEVVDTNGAGDAFMAGFLSAHLQRATTQQALSKATVQASIAISSRHLHPTLAGPDL